jgi:hypothetical protein
MAWVRVQGMTICRYGDGGITRRKRRSEQIVAVDCNDGDLLDTGQIILEQHRHAPNRCFNQVVPSRSDIQRQHSSTTNTGRVRPQLRPQEQSRAWPTYMALSYPTALLPTISTHPPSRSPHRNSPNSIQHHRSNQYTRRRRSCPRPLVSRGSSQA